MGSWAWGFRAGGLSRRPCSAHLVDHVLRRLLLDERLPVATRLGRMQRHHPAFADCRSTLQVCFPFILFAAFAHLASSKVLRIRPLSLPSAFCFPEVQLIVLLSVVPFVSTYLYFLLFCLRPLGVVYPAPFASVCFHACVRYTDAESILEPIRKFKL